MANGSFFCRDLASVTVVLNACWALVKVAGFFLSPGLVSVDLAIAMVFVVVGEKEIEERDD